MIGSDRSVLLRLVLALCHWAPMIDGLVFAGDNIGSLELALHGRVRGALGMFADEFLAGQSANSSDPPLLSPRVREGLGA